MLKASGKLHNIDEYGCFQELPRLFRLELAHRKGLRSELERSASGLQGSRGALPQ